MYKTIQGSDWYENQFTFGSNFLPEKTHKNTHKTNKQTETLKHFVIQVSIFVPIHFHIILLFENYPQVTKIHRKTNLQFCITVLLHWYILPIQASGAYYSEYNRDNPEVSYLDLYIFNVVLV